VYDASGAVVKPPKETKKRKPTDPPPPTAELEPGQTRKEMEGVFVRRGNVAEFVTIKLGISGDKYFEVLSGLKPGDEVVTGPYNSVRTIADGDEIKVDEIKKPTTSK
jgi:HlyD family secretion protein